MPLSLHQRAYNLGLTLGRYAMKRFDDSSSSSTWRAFWSGIHQAAHFKPKPPQTDWERLALEHHRGRVEAETALMNLREQHVATSKELSALKRTMNPTTPEET